MHLAGRAQPGATCESWASLDELYKQMGWLKFIGIVNLVLGIVLSLPILSLVVTWVMIWVGLMAISAANQFKQGYEEHDKYFAMKGMEELSKLVRVVSILSVVSLGLGLLLLIIAALALVLSPALLH